MIIVYIEGAGPEGAAVFVTDGTDRTIDVYESHLVVRDETFSSIGNADLNAVDETAIGDTRVPYDVLSNDLSADSNIHLWVNDNVTYQPVGTITTQGAGGSLTIRPGATLNSNGNDVTVGGSWTNSGTYSSGANTTTFTGAGATYTIDTGGVGNGQDFNDVVFNDGGGAAATFRLTGDLDEHGGYRLVLGGRHNGHLRCRRPRRTVLRHHERKLFRLCNGERRREYLSAG
jgi:hypothetical protein